MGTEANAWIRIIQSSKKHTGKQFLEQLSGNKGFRPGVIETFSLDAPEVEEVKQIEVFKIILLWRIPGEKIIISLMYRMLKSPSEKL